MLRRAVMLLGLMLLISALPLAAQDTAIAPTDFIPADFAGFIRLPLTGDTAQGLTVSAAVAAALQPLRLQLTVAPTLDSLIPFAALFDVEETSFASHVASWLDGEIILAYRQFDERLAIDTADALLILPTRNMLASAGVLAEILTGQDLPSRQEHHGTAIYVGDKSALAFTPEAVLLGPAELIAMALDARAGAVERLTDAPAYAPVVAASPAESLVFAYVRGDFLAHAVAGVISGLPDVEPLLKAFGAAAEQARGASFETRLLNSGFDGAGVSITLSDAPRILTATAIFHLTAPETVSATAFDASLLNLIPRSALLVHTGTAARMLITDLLMALPLSNFTGQIAAGLPVVTAGASEIVPAPSAETLFGAVNNFLATMQQVAGFDLEADLLSQLSGSYALALLPRPNNPLPVLRIPFDALLVARVDDQDLAAASAARLFERVFGLQPGEAETLAGWTFTPLADRRTGEIIMRVGVVQGLLVIGTGAAAPASVDAWRGDNRLVNTVAWQTLAAIERPTIYLDLDVFFNTFFPSPQRTVPSLANRVRITARADHLSDRLYSLRLTVLLPSG